MKTVSILGSTGSIGKQTVDVVMKTGMKVAAIAANRNITELIKQIDLLSPKLVCVYDDDACERLKSRLRGTKVKIVSGDEGLLETAAMKESDMVVDALVGIKGLLPALTAIDERKDVALANKESIVTGGELILEKAAMRNVNVIPVDSEHSAVFQCMDKSGRNRIKKIILTASGGPFYGKSKNDLKDIKPEDAVKHPNWSMGKKISVDSATLMNKGLELIEASKLFNVSPQNIEVVVHTQSIIHSAVEFEDNSVIAQMGVADMRLPIQYALTYPKRTVCPADELNLFEVCALTFGLPDEDTFTCLKACKEAAKRGGYYPTLVNGADEEAVQLYLDGKINFLQIGEAVGCALSLKCEEKTLSFEGIIKQDCRARNMVKKLFGVQEGI